MIDDASIDLVREALIVALKLSGPILIAGLVIGLIISLLQSITSIQDQSISLVPKMIVMLVCAVLLMPWIVQRLVEYTRELFTLL